jgi:hypothetical protein
MPPPALFPIRLELTAILTGVREGKNFRGWLTRGRNRVGVPPGSEARDSRPAMRGRLVALRFGPTERFVRFGVSSGIPLAVVSPPAFGIAQCL